MLRSHLECHWKNAKYKIVDKMLANKIVDIPHRRFQKDKMLNI